MMIGTAGRTPTPPVKKCTLRDPSLNLIYLIMITHSYLQRSLFRQLFLVMVYGRGFRLGLRDVYQYFMWLYNLCCNLARLSYFFSGHIILTLQSHSYEFHVLILFSIHGIFNSFVLYYITLNSFLNHFLPNSIIAPVFCVLLLHVSLSQASYMQCFISSKLFLSQLNFCSISFIYGCHVLLCCT